MPAANNPIPLRVNRQNVIHVVRTSIAAVVSLLIARLFKLPEAYWAAITTLVVMQSSLGAALTVSWQRFAGHVRRRNIRYGNRVRRAAA